MNRLQLVCGWSTTFHQIFHPKACSTVHVSPKAQYFNISTIIFPCARWQFYNCKSRAPLHKVAKRFLDGRISEQKIIIIEQESEYCSARIIWVEFRCHLWTLGIIWILFAIFAIFGFLLKIGYTQYFLKYCGNAAFCSIQLNGKCKDYERTKRLNGRLWGGNWGWLGWTAVVWILLWNFVIWIIGIYAFVENLTGNLRNKILSLVKWNDPYYYVVNFLWLLCRRNSIKRFENIWEYKTTFKWFGLVALNSWWWSIPTANFFHAAIKLQFSFTSTH